MRRLVVALLVAVTSLMPTAAAAQQTDAATLRIYIARHGQSTYNLSGWATGWADSPLTELGRRQARELAEVLRDTPVDAIYASTLSRSRETAEAVANGKPLRLLEGLRERHWGAFSGRPNNDPEFLRRRFIDGDALDGGETVQAFYERVRESLADIRRQHRSGTILVVGHGATNAQILRAVLGLNAQESQAIAQENDEIYALDLSEGRPPLLWKLIRTPQQIGEL